MIVSYSNNMRESDKSSETIKAAKQTLPYVFRITNKDLTRIVGELPVTFDKRKNEFVLSGYQKNDKQT